MADTDRISEDGIRFEDMSRLMAEARVLRSEAFRDAMGWTLSGLAAALRPVGHLLSGGEAAARRRTDRTLRRDLAVLDARDLRDLGLPMDAAATATMASLADHPMAAGASRRVANENAGAVRRSRSAA
jgi:hypothetical protein